MTNSDKGKRVRNMFSSIAPRYDLLNRLLSFRRDCYWRRKAVNELLRSSDTLYLDVATGTADIPLEIAGRTPAGVKIVGVDFTPEMVAIGGGKVRNSGAEGQVQLNCGDALALPFGDGLFDGVIVGFGVRNFSDLDTGLRDMKRVLRDEGRLVILEFSHPGGPIFRRLYDFYFNRILPLIGAMVSGSGDAYRYLPESVGNFPDMEGLKRRMEAEGFRDVRYIPLTFGIAAIHVGIK